MPIIYFVRHAERNTNIKIDEMAPLTNKGLKDANTLKAFFKDKNISAIYSSPYKRTVQTIQPTALYLNLKINLVPEFHERKIGSWIEDFPVYAENQWRDFDYRRENGESLNDVYNRIFTPYKHIESHINNNIIICGHGTALAVLFHHLTNSKFHYNEWMNMKMPDIYSYDVESKQLEKIKYL